MKLKIIFTTLTAASLISLIFLIKYGKNTNKTEEALENTIEQLENSDARYSDKDYFLPQKQPE